MPCCWPVLACSAGRRGAVPCAGRASMRKTTLLAGALALAFSGMAGAATCAAPDTRTSVFIGGVDSGIANVDADGAGPGNCTLNDLLKADLPNTSWASHAKFVANATAVINAVPESQLSRTQKAALIAAASASDVGNVLAVKVIAFNDFHGSFDKQGALFGVPSTGGVANMAALVQKLKAANPNNVVVSAGDLTGASPLASALFHDEGSIEVMNRLGLEFNAVGNHEFDAGAAELLRKQNGGCASVDLNGVAVDPATTCRGADVGTPVPFEGAKFKYLAANVQNGATGKTLFPAYKIKSFQGIPVAIIGMTLQGTPSIVTPAGVGGLTFTDEADTVNALIPQLRNQGVHAIVLLIHQGGFTSGGKDDCKGLSDAIVPILDRLHPEVDVIVSGHTHWAYNCVRPDAQRPDGRRLTSAGKYGQLVTDIDLAIDTRSRDVQSTRATNVVVDPSALTPVAPIQNIVDGYKALARPIAGQIIGYIDRDISKAQNAAGESQAGDLVGDAFLEATAPADKGGAVVAFTNYGGLRGTDPVFAYSATHPNNKGAGDGKVSYDAAFTFMPFGNNLVVLDLTGDDLKRVLEQQFVPSAKAPASCTAWNTQTSGGRFLQPSASLSYAWSASRPDCDKIDGSTLKINGAVVDPAATYRVTVNSFLATGGDGFTIFNKGTNRLGGAQDIDAQVAWWKANTSASAPYSPAPLNRIRKF
ncbi:bifunctional metallophosphatase/5'-nucleotidase [Rhodocyclus tenuis]|uniref:Bifunctional metallophosphatase/5'-nucleotidase n=2 Tax=Rhodocyclus TaxID=1064 RepID=A0A6L5JVR2_RHOTE|nr:bifunctional metallophosphatase/5'-nucleotidase [Rhodocyclus gracilis]